MQSCGSAEGRLRADIETRTLVSARATLHFSRAMNRLIGSHDLTDPLGSVTGPIYLNRTSHFGSNCNPPTRVEHRLLRLGLV